MKIYKSKMIVSFILLILLISSSCTTDTSLKDKVVEFKLDNGMKWLLLKRGYAPVFAGVVQVKTGGADEKPGKTGIAHFLEHMAFKGTTTLGTTNYEKEKEIISQIDLLIDEKLKLVHDKADKSKIAEVEEQIEKLIEEQRQYIVSNEIFDTFIRNGTAKFNASTSKDVTTFYADMPVSKLELWIYLSSEMLRDPTFREFYKEKQVILEEMRTSIDNSPRGRIYEKLLATVFSNNPYAWMVIGKRADIENLTRKDIKNFYENNYLPECMVGAIVGDIDIDETKKYLTEYYGQLKGKGQKCNKVINLDPPQIESKESVVEYDAEPTLLMSFRKPTAPNFDDYIFDVYVYLLCEGESSRMKREIVQKKKLAKRISCFSSFPGTRLPHIFSIYAEPYDIASINELKEAILLELDKLKTEPITDMEFNKIKNQMITDFVMQMDNNNSLARMMVDMENMVDSWKYLLSHPDNIEKITTNDLMNTAKKYFVPENMITIELRRKNEN